MGAACMDDGCRDISPLMVLVSPTKRCGKVIVGCGSVGDEDHLVVHHHGIAGGGLAADIGGSAGDDHGVDVAGPGIGGVV